MADFVIMETVGAPISITAVSDNSATAGQSVTVAATLSAAPSSEYIYVRYSTNSWSTSALVAGTVSGTTATMNMPNMPIGTAVEYYVLATTVSNSTTLASYTDLCTLTGLKNGANNFTYTVTAVPVTPVVSSNGATVVKLDLGTFQVTYTAVNFSGTVNWSHTVTPAIAGSALSPATGNTTTFTATPAATGTYSLVVVASDGSASVTNTTPLTVNAPAFGNAWHFPTNTGEPWPTATMRDPLAPSGNGDVWLRVGTWPDGLGVADAATAVSMVYRVNGASWTQVNMAWETNYSSGNGAWSNAIPVSALAAGNTVDYYFMVEFANNAALDTTYLGTANQTNCVTYATAAQAQANAFSFTIPAAAPILSFTGNTTTNLGSQIYLVYTVANLAAPVTWSYFVTPTPAGGGFASTNDTTAHFFVDTATAGTYTVVVIATGADAAVTNTTDLTIVGPTLGNTWHYPTNTGEPWPTATMRDPLEPETGNEVWLRVGTYPDGYGEVQSATGVSFRYREGNNAWAQPIAMTWETNNAGGAGFWAGQLPTVSIVEGEEISYYFVVGYGSGSGLDTTYIGTTNQAGCELYAAEANAQANAFTFTVGAAAVELELGNAWHIPANEEPWESATMRFPLNPEVEDVWFRVGTYPNDYNGSNSATAVTLNYQIDGGIWAHLPMAWETNYGAILENAVWTNLIPVAELNADDVVNYYFTVDYTNAGTTLMTTYLGTTNQADSVAYSNEVDAVANAFTFTVAAYVPVFGNAWHYPTNAEPWDTATMRDPLAPEGGRDVWLRVGQTPHGSANPDSATSITLKYQVNHGAWSSVELVWERAYGMDDGNGCWSNTIPGNAFVAGDTVGYYFIVAYTNAGAAYDTTYLGATNVLASVPFATEAEAQASPFTFTATAYVPVPGNVWHFPTNTEPWETATMRNPVTPHPDRDTYIYVGNHFGATGADMTGGIVWYRNANSGAWISNGLAHDVDRVVQDGTNQFWVAMIPSNTLALGDILEYYIQVDYLNGGADTTFIGTSNQTDNVLLGTVVEAAGLPFLATCVARPADLGNCWHVPGAFEPWPGATMRNPCYPSKGDAIAFFVGNQASGDGGTPGNMTGGTLYHRLQGTGPFTSVALAYETGVGNNKFWIAVVDGNAYPNAGDIEYYFEVNYDDRDVTYLGNSGSGFRGAVYATAAEAMNNLFECPIGDEPGKEPGFVWHAGNVARISEDTVQFWVKIGYVNDGFEWADNVELRYNFQTGAIPAGAFGALSIGEPVEALALTNYSTATFVRSHEDADTSEHGNSIWWRCELTDANFADGAYYLEYQVAAWKSVGNGGNDVVRFADYKTSSATNMFYYTMWKQGANELTINGLNGDYTTTKLFLDEAQGETVELVVRYNPPIPADEVEIFSNVNRRDFWNADIDGNGIPDAIYPPPGDLVTPSRTDSYYAAIPMTEQGGGYETTITVSNCGAYRLTARYKPVGSNGWIYYSETGSGIRDHAVVVSPKKVLQQNVYELNALTVKATDTTMAGRSTFGALINPASTNQDTFDEFSIEYLNKIQANCLWFQPIHPSSVTGVDINEGPGSPYSTKDYFAISSWFSTNNTETAAKQEFADFVAACDLGRTGYMTTSYVGTINIMLDGVMNHTSWDAILGEWGVEYLASKGQTTWQDKYGQTHAITADTPIGCVRPGWYANYSDYGMPATFFWSPTDHDVATAPDRADFGKWYDTAEVFYGRYAALVRHNPEDNGNHLNEGDWFDWSVMTDGQTAELWEYMGAYPEYWITNTGHIGYNTFGAVNGEGVMMDDQGIDGLRCDFAQGLPPQFWEYIINRTRAVKWNFMFMAESLDGGNVSYRSNRHFDILNESFVFQMVNSGGPGDVQSAVETRKSMYNGGAILLNLTSHDEIMPFADPWKTASRYAIVSTVQGLPMAFFGQEQGIAPLVYSKDGKIEGDSVPGTAGSGFAFFELNMGKWVPHFKNWNRLTVWDFPPSATWPDGDPEESRHMAQWYGRVSWARLNSPALQSGNQYYLGRKDYVDNSSGTYDHGLIWAVAKYEEEGALLNGKDAVLAFVLFLDDGHTPTSETYAITPEAAARLGIEPNGFYTARNLAAADAEAILWSKSGAELLNDGIWVGFASDANGSKLYDDHAMVQYLKLEEAPPPEVEIIVSGDEDGTVGLTNSFSVIVTGSDVTTVAATLNGNAYDGFTYTNEAITFLPSVTGTYVFTISASNLWYQPSTNITIVITDLPVAPSFTVTDVANGEAGTENTFTVIADNADEVWDSATLDSVVYADYVYSNNLVSFTPATTGTYVFTFTASNAFNLGATTNVTVLITNVPVTFARITALETTVEGGEIVVTLNSDYLDAAATNIWTADELSEPGPHWNWTNDATGVTLNGGGSITIRFLTNKNIRLISVGKPAYMTNSPP